MSFIFCVALMTFLIVFLLMLKSLYVTHLFVLCCLIKFSSCSCKRWKKVMMIGKKFSLGLPQENFFQPKRLKTSTRVIFFCNVVFPELSSCYFSWLTCYFNQFSLILDAKLIFNGHFKEKLPKANKCIGLSNNFWITE